jgi:hypothetical protein
VKCLFRKREKERKKRGTKRLFGELIQRGRKKKDDEEEEEERRKKGKKARRQKGSIGGTEREVHAMLRGEGSGTKTVVKSKKGKLRRKKRKLLTCLRERRLARAR